MTRVLRYITIALGSLISAGLNAQDNNPYHINGSASQENCNCYTLTPDAFNQSGSVWNINKINLNDSFDFKFSVYLGCHDGDGADGIAFVLQPVSTSIGSVGEGIGYEGITPSIGVLIDTWQNYEQSDPTYDHISIHRNGVINHSDMNNVTTAVPVLPNSENIEDCKWHSFRITWEPLHRTLSTYFDNIFRTSATVDLINDVFHGDPLLFWGFTSATGGAKNLQKFCTSLDPKFVLPEGQLSCFPQEINFIDSSSSFGSIVKWFWDFGDGTTSESSNPPAHNYSSPGNYDVQLKILGNNGCLSEPFTKRIVMGSIPEAAFTWSPRPVCEGTPITFLDSSYVEFGTINSWNWTIGAQTFSTKDPPSMVLNGTNSIGLSVGTLEGCASSETTTQITSYPSPSVDFDMKSSICVSEPLVLAGINNNTAVQVNQWAWNYGDGINKSSADPNHEYRYPKGGVYDVQLTGYSPAGCPSLPVVKSVQVYETNAFAGNDTIVATNQPIVLHGTGGQFFKWSPSAGLSADNIPDPVAILPRDAQFILTASTEAGCATTDTLNIKVFDGPAFYVPSAFSPNNDGKNDKFQFIAVGMKSVDLFQVFNRYGQLVYSSSKFMEGWDGRSGGSNQAAGTYVWMIKGVDLNGITHFKKGTVTLVR